MNSIGAVFILTTLHFNVVTSSIGDTSWIFQRCLSSCLHKNCTNKIFFYAKQPFYLKLLKWDCEDECKYTCMWKTVDAFKRDSLKSPQFYGKWPFIRLFGIQEPASAFFSFLNLLSHLMIFKFRADVPRGSPMYCVWHFLALVGIHTWIWSIIFHSRDTPITEMMDYYCAFSLIMFNAFTFCCRVIGTHNAIKVAGAGSLLLAFYLQHIYYMTYIKFDYGYNMTVNVGIGIVQSLLWFIWCARLLSKQPYVWKCMSVVILTNLLISLELGDFSPLWWVFDAHSLWHAGTVPLAILWYSFAIDDCHHLLKEKKNMALKGS